MCEKFIKMLIPIEFLRFCILEGVKYAEMTFHFVHNLSASFVQVAVYNFFHWLRISDQLVYLLFLFIFLLFCYFQLRLLYFPLISNNFNILFSIVDYSFSILEFFELLFKKSSFLFLFLIFLNQGIGFLVKFC